jgi:stage II sporulation protein AA (anti-sigma F factor antagonist)
MIELVLADSQEADRGGADKQVVAMKGSLDTLSVADAETRFAALGIDPGKPLTFNLAELTYISSSGLRFLLGVKKKAVAAGGDVAVVQMSETVEKIFKVVGFDALFAARD